MLGCRQGVLATFIGYRCSGTLRQGMTKPSSRRMLRISSNKAVQLFQYNKGGGLPRRQACAGLFDDDVVVGSDRRAFFVQVLGEHLISLSARAGQRRLQSQRAHCKHPESGIHQRGSWVPSQWQPPWRRWLLQVPSFIHRARCRCRVNAQLASALHVEVDAHTLLGASHQRDNVARLNQAWISSVSDLDVDMSAHRVAFISGRRNSSVPAPQASQRLLEGSAIGPSGGEHVSRHRPGISLGVIDQLREGGNALGIQRLLG